MPRERHAARGPCTALRREPTLQWRKTTTGRKRRSGYTRFSTPKGSSGAPSPFRSTDEPEAPSVSSSLPVWLPSAPAPGGSAEEARGDLAVGLVGFSSAGVGACHHVHSSIAGASDGWLLRTGLDMQDGSRKSSRMMTLPQKANTSGPRSLGLYTARGG